MVDLDQLIKENMSKSVSSKKLRCSLAPPNVSAASISDVCLTAVGKPDVFL